MSLNEETSYRLGSAFAAAYARTYGLRLAVDYVTRVLAADETVPAARFLGALDMLIVLATADDIGVRVSGDTVLA